MKAGLLLLQFEEQPLIVVALLTQLTQLLLELGLLQAEGCNFRLQLGKTTRDFLVFVDESNSSVKVIFVVVVVDVT